MNPIKEFFKRKAAERKFKTAGPAHKLSESAAPKDNSGSHSSHRSQSSHPHTKSKEAERAGAAALERIQQQQQQSNLNWTSQAIKNRAKKELEMENSLKGRQLPPPRQIVTAHEDLPNFTVSGVYFTCPIIGPDVLAKAEIEAKIKSFLYEQLEEERGLTACLIIHTLNKNKSKVQKGIETLARYLTNIIDEPTEEKYRKIRIQNKAFQERIADLEGAFDFLAAAGFSKQMLKIDSGEEEEYLVFQEDKLDVENLQMLKEALLSSEPIIPVLDRNLKVLKPADIVEKVNLPQDFFALTLEEVKREQEARAETVEMLTTLRTKEMREREEIRERRMYRYTLIRIRFPDGIILQGTFSVYEKLSAVREFVSENLQDPSKEYDFLLPGGIKLSDNDQTLLQLKLVPAVILNFQSLNDGSSHKVFLNSRCMALLSEL